MSRRIVPILLFGVCMVCWSVLVSAVGVRMADDTSKVVRMRDECDESFNVFFGDPAICLQAGGKVDVFSFLDYLTKHHRHPQWKFDPAAFDLPEGKHVVIQNLGGEVHTWTEVEEFGGGFIPELNFGEEPRPECFDAPGINNVFLEYGQVGTGATAGSADLPSGQHKFMCCIHPWMRTVVKVNK